MHAVNVDGTFRGCHYGVGAMRPMGTTWFINISSRAGLVGIPGAAGYASSKTAIRNHTRTVALWCAQQGLAIRCNAILPTAIMTPMWDPMMCTGPDRNDRAAALDADTPLRRFGTPEEVAALAVLLVGDEGRDMTGTDLFLDDGLLAGSAAPG